MMMRMMMELIFLRIRHTTLPNTSVKTILKCAYWSYLEVCVHVRTVNCAQIVVIVWLCEMNMSLCWRLAVPSPATSAALSVNRPRTQRHPVTVVNDVIECRPVCSVYTTTTTRFAILLQCANVYTRMLPLLRALWGYEVGLCVCVYISE